ncbi:hypothetical protein [Methanoregula sp.]|uniref:hypothetical protein n=1 Tax=Methanoregula sp. TaxID=2052170 RepID=UPI002624692C|nr:hypothetical protein [Methanoregula sp.]MDD5143104.1 hypothetical protein [Methanoregula sp.]
MMKQFTKISIISVIIASLVIASFPAAALTKEGGQDLSPSSTGIGIDEAKNRIVDFDGNSKNLNSLDFKYHGSIKFPYGEVYDFSEGKNRYYVNKENGDIEFAYFSDARSSSHRVHIDKQQAKNNAEIFAKEKYKTFITRNMELTESTLIDHGAGGQEYAFVWSEKINGVSTLNKIYITVDSDNGKIISYLAKERETKINLEPNVRQSDAVRAALEQFGNLKDSRTDAYLSLACPEPDVQQLVWIVKVNAAPVDGLVQGGQVVVDAQNGKIILFNPFN